MPRHDIKVSTLIDTRKGPDMTSTDFSPKSEIHLASDNNSSKGEKPGKKCTETPMFLDQSLAESDNESDNN